MISFRVGAYDAEVLEKEFAPVFTAEDIVNLGFTQVYLKLMIDGVGSRPFSAKTLDTPPRPGQMFLQEIIESSRTLYAQPRRVVEEAITKWHEGAGGAEKANSSGQSSPARYDKPRERNGDFNGSRNGDRNGERYSERNGDRNNGSRDHRNDRGTGPQRPQNSRPGNGEARVADQRPQPAPKVHKPFQEAIKQVVEATEQSDDPVEREKHLREAVSLSFLKARADNEDEREKARERERVKQDTKKPTQENLSSLRQALKDVLQEAGVKPAVPVAVAPTQATPKPVQQASLPKPASAQPKEIPEDELKALLHVDKPE
jgi:hypothetical protein